MLSQIFSIISLVLTAYSFIIFIRILFSWFNLRNNSNGASQNKIAEFLYSITDPYLNWFRRFSFLRLGMMDFSAMLAIGVLYFFSNISAQIAATGVITVSFLIKLIISTVWSLASSISLFIIFVFIARIIFLQLNKYSQIFSAMDGYIESAARKFSNIFSKKFTPYKINLIILTAGIMIARLAINYVIVFLFSLF
jgi:YggT family protein